MNAVDATENLWWIASRSAGVVALVLLTLSTIAGLMLGGRLAGPGARGVLRPASLRSLHEQLSLAALVMTGLHAVTLLGDRWLEPTIADIAIPFASDHRPLFTGLGIISAYAAVLVSASYYARDRIGNRTWRRMHRISSAVYVLAILHTLGAGTDGFEPWLFIPAATGAAIVAALFTIRVGSALTKRPVAQM